MSCAAVSSVFFFSAAFRFLSLEALNRHLCFLVSGLLGTLLPQCFRVSFM